MTQYQCVCVRCGSASAVRIRYGIAMLVHCANCRLVRVEADQRETVAPDTKIMSTDVRWLSTYLSPTEDNYPITPIVAVLVRGDRGDDVAAYVGNGPPEWVARYGDKLSEREARGYFSWPETMRYRP